MTWQCKHPRSPSCSKALNDGLVSLCHVLCGALLAPLPLMTASGGGALRSHTHTAGGASLTPKVN